MGVAITWFAFEGLEKEAAYAALRLVSVRHGERARAHGGRLPNGWSLVLVEGANDRWMTDRFCAGLNPRGRTVAWQLEEHVMYSVVAQWTGGACDWRVWHSGESGDDSLETRGTVPECLPDIERWCRQQQARDPGADHVIEVPALVAEAVTGFNYAEADVSSFEPLRFDGPAPWASGWSRLLRWRR